MRAAALDEREKPPTERLVTAAGRYITTYTKTLRKRGFQFRYIFVPELHRDGFPHFHGLIHDQGPDLIKWADLAACWVAGFQVSKAVRDARALRYVTKYLSKDRLGRVRASLNYGARDGDQLLPGETFGQYWTRSHPRATPPIRSTEASLTPPSEGGGGKECLRLNERRKE